MAQPEPQHFVLDDSDDEFEDPAGFELLEGPPRAEERNRVRFEANPFAPRAQLPKEEDDNADPLAIAVAGPSRNSNAAAAPPQGRAASGEQVLIIDIGSAKTVVPRILDLIPDVCPKHALGIVSQVLRTPMSASDVVSRVLEILFESPTYPKGEKGKGKRKRDDDSGDEGGMAGPSKRNGKGFDWDDSMDVDGQIEYRSEKAGLDSRRGIEYLRRAQRDLQNTFPLMTVSYISNVYGAHNNLYVPTHFALRRETELPPKSRAYQDMKIPRAYKPEAAKKGKGKAKARGRGPQKKKKVVMVLDEDGDEVEVVQEEEEISDGGERAYLEEKSWLMQYLREQGDKASMEIIKILEPPEGEGDTECQCCFGEEHLVFMVQCEDGHLFCRDCVERFVSNLIGEQKAPATCMDGSGCKSRFTDRELRKALPGNLLNTYHNLCQRKELEAAGIEGLESCPACEYAVVIDNEHEKLFNCERDDCGLISCRACRKPDHIPKTCAEAAKDSKLDHRHLVEEAMTTALVRYCPNDACKKPFLKETGCNKITCSSCQQISCYVCKRLIKDGYNHFDQSPADYSRPKDGKKCRLWDPKTGDPYRQEVADARDKAQAEALARAAEAGHEVGEEDVNVALPEARPNPIAPNMPILPDLQGLGNGFGRQAYADMYAQYLAPRPRPAAPPGAVAPAAGAAGVQINHFHFGVPPVAGAAGAAEALQRDALVGNRIMEDLQAARRQRVADRVAGREADLEGMRERVRQYRAQIDALPAVAGPRAGGVPAAGGAVGALPAAGAGRRVARFQDGPAAGMQDLRDYRRIQDQAFAERELILAQHAVDQANRAARAAAQIPIPQAAPQLARGGRGRGVLPWHPPPPAAPPVDRNAFRDPARPGRGARRGLAVPAIIPAEEEDDEEPTEDEDVDMDAFDDEDDDMW